MRKNISRTKGIIFTAAVVFTLCALTVGMVYAKYVDERSSNGLIGADVFYFTSNLLDGKEHTIAPGSTSFSFTLGNHEDDLRWSKVDVEYKYFVTDEGGNMIDQGTGVLPKDDINDHKITASGLQGGKTYTVTATGTGGYSKTLTAKIVVPPKTKQLYYHIDTSADEYTLLTVWNEGDIPGIVTIQYKGIPDNTNPNMGGWLAGVDQLVTADSITIDAHESKVFRFFGGKNISVIGAKAKELY